MARAGFLPHDAPNARRRNLTTVPTLPPQHDRATGVAAALLETLGDARELLGVGREDPDLVETTARACDLQARLHALVARAAPTANDALASICAATGVLVAALQERVAPLSA